MTGRLSAVAQLGLARLCWRESDGSWGGDGQILDFFVGLTVSSVGELRRGFADSRVDYLVLRGPDLGLVRAAARLGPRDWVQPWFVAGVRERDLAGVLAAGARRLILADSSSAFVDRADRGLRASWAADQGDRIPRALLG